MAEVQRPAEPQVTQTTYSTTDSFPASTTAQMIDDAGYDEGAGWKLYASVLLILAAAWNIIYGLIAVFDDNFFDNIEDGTGVELPITNTIEAWGWTSIGLGVLLLAAAFGIMRGAMWARIVGVIVIGANMIFHMGYLSAFPFWSALTIGLLALALYGLVVHGGRPRTTY
jgi:hypothetical protein